MQQTDLPVITARGTDVVALLSTEHEGLRASFAQATCPTEGAVRRYEVLKFARLLVRHITGEQCVVYPVVARIAGGDEFRSEMLRQERELATYLARLLRRLAWHPGGRGLQRRIHCFSELLEHHLTYEARSLLPILLALESEQKRQLMGTWLCRAEALASPRPHPHGPQRPAGLLTIGLAIGIVDRLRNAGSLAARGADVSRSQDGV